MKKCEPGAAWKGRFPYAHSLLGAFFCLTLASPATPAADSSPSASQANPAPARAEAEQAIARGLSWLRAHQNSDGSWSNPEQPGLTALPLTAFLGVPSEAQKPVPRPAIIEKGFSFLRSMAKPDGSIFDQGLSNYNTSICLMAFLAGGDPRDEPLMARARAFIVDQQAKNMLDESLDGGIGYGPTGVSVKRQHPDLDNTLIGLEALKAYKDTHPQVEVATGKQLNWKAAIEFISRCQNLPEKNPKGSANAEDRGGFVYFPGYSNAAPDDGSDPLRSYGTMTYAGLLSFIYADLKKDDPRVQSALEWLKKNFSVDQNPNMGPAGLYYYLHLMSKGLTAAAVPEVLDLADGRKVNWVQAAARKLISLQKADGSWVNGESGRWMEKDQVLVTSYSIMSLELLYPKL